MVLKMAIVMKEFNRKLGTVELVVDNKTQEAMLLVLRELQLPLVRQRQVRLIGLLSVVNDSHDFFGSLYSIIEALLNCELSISYYFS